MQSLQSERWNKSNKVSRGFFDSEKATRQHCRRELTLKLASKISPSIKVIGGQFVNVETGEVCDGRANEFELRAAAYGAILAAAAEPGNQFAGLLDGGKQGAYPAAGTLWKSSLRVDPNWMEALRRRSRKRARLAVRRANDGLSRFERIGKSKGWSWAAQWRLVTLGTLPGQGARSETEVKVANRAWRLFSRREAWSGEPGKSRLVLGGIKGIEDAIDERGPYVHLHCLCLARRLDYDAVKAAWNECYRTAADEMGVSVRPGVPTVSILRVTARREPREGGTTEDAALDECVKYATKGEELAGDGVPREVLVDLCDVGRWSRMFELFGTCREPKRPQGADLDTACISVGDLLARRKHAVDEVAKIMDDIRNQALEPDEEPRTEGQMESAIMAYLGQNAKRKRKRPPSWRDMLPVMLLSRWWHAMTHRIERAKEYRLKWLLTHNPLCQLANFAGDVLCDQRPDDFLEFFG